MLGKFLPAATVAAQHLQNALNGGNVPKSPGKTDHAGTGLTSTAPTPATAFSPFANAAMKSQSPTLLAAGPLVGAPQDNSEAEHEPKSKTIFSDEDKQKMKDAKNLYVAGFSSQGGGHTERLLMPLGMAAQKGDTIVLALPPHWEADEGNEGKKLNEFAAEYKKKGINLVTVQSDKAIWGFYKAHGPSDNFRILDEFANKPKRDSENTPLFGTSDQKGQGFMHKDIVQQVVDVVGRESIAKVKVFEDMDPYLGKAAAKAGIPVVMGQSNHLLLLDADEYFGAKSDAFLVKANGNGYNTQMATVDFNAEINRTRALGMTLSKLGITADQKAVDVRKDMVATLLEKGKIHDLDSSEPVSMKGAVLVAPGATKESIDRGVYLYLNKYTSPIAEHIVERLKGEGDTTPELHDAYKKTLICFCGTGALTEKLKGGADNSMHVAQAAQFDGVTAAGFGTASEMHYLLENNAYKGNFLLMPVEQQHEQDANAHALLPAVLSEGNKGRVETAGNIDELKAKFDQLVLSRATTDKVLGDTTMEAFVQATQREGASGSDKAAQLLRGTGAGMTQNDARLMEENNWRAQEAGRKEMRHLNKVMIPVLEALAKGESEATIRLSTKVDERRVNVEELVKGLNNPAKLRELTGVNITNQLARNMSDALARDLEQIMKQSEGPDRQKAADDYRRDQYANKKYNVGY